MLRDASNVMPVGFGFSVGDFIAALELLGTVIDALRDSGNASTNFKALVDDVEQLKLTLLRVQQVRLDPRLRNEELGIDAAATRGLLAIEHFWRKVQKYEPHLYTGDKRLNIRDIFARVRWAVCKKEDVEEFRTRMQSLNTNFTILLATIQMQISHLDAQDRKSEHADTISTLSNHANAIMATVTSLPQGLKQCLDQTVAVLDASGRTLAMLVQVFTMVGQIHSAVISVPAQVLWQKPVEFWDPFGRLRPFHLDLVKSREHLLSFLMVDMEQAGCNENDKALFRSGSYNFSELRPGDIWFGRGINLDRPWEQCFYPGQTVAMTMVHHVDVELNIEQISCDKVEWYVIPSLRRTSN